MSVVDLNKNVIFEKSIIISRSEGTEQDNTGTAGQLRFNQKTLKFEGYHCYPNSNNGADIFNNKWRSLTQDVASRSNLGIFRVGQNLIINPTTGILSSIASGSSRFKQLVITISPILGAADYLSINEAIKGAIGTPENNYTDGTLTSNIGSAPSPTYPFVIQLAPGQYSEPSNTIVLPDYVSLRGEGNYTSVITQNSGNVSISTSSMLIIGENCEVKNLSLTLGDLNASQISCAIYSLNKSNVVIDNCIINCSSNINTTLNTYGIFIDGGYNNTITNNKITLHSSTLTGLINSIYIHSSIVKIINNNINILVPNITESEGIVINKCIGTESINDKTYIENLILTNNYYNSISGTTNIGISVFDSSIILKNSDIEVSNNNTLTNNYGIYFNNPSQLQDPYLGVTSSNVISFINTTTGFNAGVNTINSSNISVVNFLTQTYEGGQYISVDGSSFNDGIYKIGSLTSNIITLDNGYNLNNETRTLTNTITLKGLYDINIYNSKISGSTNTIYNPSPLSSPSPNNNYIVNIDNVINEGGPYNISPSYIFYNNYKTITVGKVNCDYNSLYNAMNSISDNTLNIRYIIKIQSGIYHETQTITCKQYVDIEGISTDNTILQFYQAFDSSGVPQTPSTPFYQTSCLLVCSNMSIKNMSIKNSSTLYTPDQTTSIVLYNPLQVNNLILENLSINSNCSSVYNTGIFLDTSNNITLRNLDINIYSNTTSINNIGIYNKNSTNNSLFNVSTTITSTYCTNNYSLYLKDSECNIYNPNFVSNSGQTINAGIYTENTNNTQKLVQIYSGQIRAYNNIDYSIYCDNYYTIQCNGIQLLGDTHCNSTFSHIYSNSCYTFTDENDKYNIQSLNSRGQNEQLLRTITLGDSAGKRYANGIYSIDNGTDNVFIGTNSGSNVTTESYNTFLGSNTGKNTTSGNNNTLIGSYAGTSLTTGIQNTIVGSNAAISITSGSYNVINGYKAGSSITTSTNNVILGTSAGNKLTQGNLNVFVGQSTGLKTTIANQNTFIGSYSGMTNTTGIANTYLGYNTGNASITGSNNVLLGNQAGYHNLTSNIVALGTHAGYNNIYSVKNTYIGHNSGYNNVSGSCNTYLGYKAGYGSSLSPVTGSFNITIGNEAGYSITSGSRNILVGSTKSTSGTSNDAAGWSLQTGSDNVHIGLNSGPQAISSINNVLIGTDVGTALTSSSNNILIGKNTGNLITTKGGNIILGSGSGNNNSYGNALIVGQNAGVNYTGNVAFTIGHNAGNNVSGNFNMYIGQNAGGYPGGLKSGNNNLTIGPYSGYFLSSGSRNIIVGSGDNLKSTGRIITSGNDNTLLGYQAGQAIQTGHDNTLLGSQAGYGLTSGSDNLILGYKSAYNLGTGSQNICLGPESGYNLSTGYGNIMTGYKAGYKATSGYNNINIGVEAGYTGNATFNNINIGYNAGYYSNASGNLFIGAYAGVQNTDGANNIFLGLNSGSGYNTSQAQIADNNIFIGTNTGTTNYTGENNIFIGLNSGKYNLNGSKNIFMGENTGLNTNLSHNIFIGTTSTPNTGIGYQSRTDGPSGQGEKNLFIGHDVGIENTTGLGNIFLGDSAGKNNTSGEQNIYIGTNAGNKGTNVNTLTANYNIAIGYNAGINNTVGQENILIGKEVAGYTTEGNSYYENIIIGSRAGQYINQNNQIFIGTNAGRINTTGDRNIFIGLNAGTLNVISNDNVVIGSDAGTALKGNGLIGDNVLIGAQAGQLLETGTNNIYIGSGAGTSATTSINNVVIGAKAMNQGNANNVIIIGNNAGLNNQSDANIFIGSNAGVHNSTGIGNIFIGYESGYNVNSNGNIIFGNQTISTGQISDNNIILGNQTAKNVVNKTNFTNNIIMGSNAGKDSSLSINSIILGSQAVDIGTGGDVNIIMGNNTAINLGNPNPYYAKTITIITTLINYVYINIPFGTGGYYFKANDFIIIESLNNNYVFQTQIINIFSGTGIYINQTKLLFITKPLSTIPIGSTLYVKNTKVNSIGKTDYSKSSSNMCIGDHNGYKLTTGNKNSAIGDNAMYNNNVGNYNIVLGTESGYNLNTNNNLCLGIQAGYSIDKYKNTNTLNNLIFNSNTNSILYNTIDPIFTSTLNLNNYYYGMIFDIIGSSNNDNRYTLKSINNNEIIISGFPTIIENGVELYNDFLYTLSSSKFHYTSNVYTSSNIIFNSNQTSIIIQFNNSIDSSNYFKQIQYISHITISNSTFNDGVKFIDYFYQYGIVNYEVMNQVILYIQENVYNEPYIKPITLTVNNIYYISNLPKTSLCADLFANDIITINYGVNQGLYKVSNKSRYYYNYYNSYDQIPQNISGILIDKIPLKTTYDNINNITTKGNNSYVKYSPYISTAFYPDYIQFLSEGNYISTIVLLKLPTTSSFLISINGTKYNDGIFYVLSYQQGTAVDYSNNIYRYNIYIDPNFPLINEQVYFNNNKIITIKIIPINSTNFSLFYNSNKSFQGNIISVKYRNNIYNNFAFGTYVLENFYNNYLNLNNLLLPFNIVTQFPGQPIVQQNYGLLNILFSDNNIKTKTNNYLSSYDVIFQTSNIAYSNITFYSSNTTIISHTLYDFVDIVAPVIIKIENSINNNGFYLVTENNRPFNKLILDNPIINETNNIIIKTNSISSYLGNINLSTIEFNKQYITYGSVLNDSVNFSLYNNPNARSNVSIYLSDTTSIVNETTNNFKYDIIKTDYKNSIYGKFLHFTIDNASIYINTSSIITIIDTTNILNSLHNNFYIRISNNAIFNGLYCINTISSVSTTYTLTLYNTYDNNYNIVNTLFSAHIGQTFTCNLISNQFTLYIINDNPLFIGNSSFNFNKYIKCFSYNAKFIEFSKAGYNNTYLNDSLTFEIDSFNLNLSNVSIALVELCPNYNYNYNNDYFKFNFGSPAPASRPKDIYRKNKRPIMYSSKDISLNLDFQCNSSSNTINIITNTYTSFNYSNNILYGKTFQKDSFEMFKPGQIFYMTTPLNSNYYLINSISNDFKTLYLNTSFSILTNETILITRDDHVPYDGVRYLINPIVFSLKYSLNDNNLDFSIIKSNLLSDPQNYILKLNKNNEGTNIVTSNNEKSYINSDFWLTLDLILPSSSKTYLGINDPFGLYNTFYLQELCMNNTLLIPVDNIVTNYTNISFHNLTITGSNDITFHASNNTITSSTTNLSSFLKCEYILISNTDNNNGLICINDSISPTTHSIIISSNYQLVNEINKTAIIKANNINTANSIITNLSIFNGGQILIINNTNFNNIGYTSNINSNSNNSIFIDFPNVVNEIPNYCTIEKSLLINETSSIVSTNVTNDILLNTSNNTINSTTTDLSNFRIDQNITIIDGYNFSTYLNTISSNVIPINNFIEFKNQLPDMLLGRPILRKNINFNIIGIPNTSVINNNYTSLANYEDSQGNNCMLGSFSGLYTGSLNNSIYNVAIGSRCAQLNHGSGNIFIGNESITATSNAQFGSTTYNNKFAIYKTNTIGISSRPLIGGDFGSGKVGINTINPEAFNVLTDVTITDIKLVVNGSILANAYSPFTGCHLINFANSNIASNVQVGMILSSTGIINKSSIINTYCTVDLSKIQNDKTVFGIYAFSEQTKSSIENEYIINSNGEYVKNPLYTTNMTTLHYVAALGEGCILVSNYGGEIQNGDYITTCPLGNGGYGALQSDDILHSYTVAKCTENINWSSIQPSISYNGTIYKVYLAGCTYHCG